MCVQTSYFILIAYNHYGHACCDMSNEGKKHLRSRLGIVYLLNNIMKLSTAMLLYNAGYTETKLCS